MNHMQEAGPAGNNAPIPPINFCFFEPAQLPRWCWLPTAYKIQEEGHNYYIPDLHRGDLSLTMDMRIDAIEDALRDSDLRYLVAWSRGVEYATRYLHRLTKKETLGKVIGMTIIHSAGPRGYEVNPGVSVNEQVPRHTKAFRDGIHLNHLGLEVLDRQVARTCMLHDIQDSKFLEIIIRGLVDECPLTYDEVLSIPHLDKAIPPTAWYIGLRDHVDNTAISAGIASQKFGITPKFREWGHVGPLTNTEEVVRDILAEAYNAYNQREAK